MKYLPKNRQAIPVIGALFLGIALGWSIASPYTKAPCSAIPIHSHKKVEKQVTVEPVPPLSFVSVDKAALFDALRASILLDNQLPAESKTMILHDVEDKSQAIMQAYATSHHAIILSNKVLIAAPNQDITPNINASLTQAIQQEEEAEGVSNLPDLAWAHYCQSPEFEARQARHEQTVEESRNCFRVLTSITAQKNFDLALDITVPEFAHQKEAAKEKKA